MELSYFRRQPPATIFDIFIPVTFTDDVYPCVFDMDNSLGMGGALFPAATQAHAGGNGFLPGGINSLDDIAMVWYTRQSDTNRFYGEFGAYAGQQNDPFDDFGVQTTFDINNVTHDEIQITKLDADLSVDLSLAVANAFYSLQVVSKTQTTQEVTLLGFIIYIS